MFKELQESFKRLETRLTSRIFLPIVEFQDVYGNILAVPMQMCQDLVVCLWDLQIALALTLLLRYGKGSSDYSLRANQANGGSTEVITLSCTHAEAELLILHTLLLPVINCLWRLFSMN